MFVSSEVVELKSPKEFVKLTDSENEQTHWVKINTVWYVRLSKEYADIFFVNDTAPLVLTVEEVQPLLKILDGD